MLCLLTPCLVGIQAGQAAPESQGQRPLAAGAGQEACSNGQAGGSHAGRLGPWWLVCKRPVRNGAGKEHATVRVASLAPLGV